MTTESNQYPALTSSRKGIFLQTEYFAGNQIASEDNTGYNVVPYGYFTYRHMSDDEIFHFNINDIVENGIVSTLYPVFTTTEELDSRYLQYQLNHGHEFARFAVLQKQGGSRTYMYLSKLKQLSLTMPKTVDEQKQISGFFMELDHLITLHQCKCYLLLKLLHNDWEQRKLEDIMDTVTDYVAAGSFEDIRNNVTYLNEPGYAQLVRTVDLKKEFTNNDSIYVDESTFKYLWRVNLNEECIVLPNIGANIGEVYFVEPSSLPYDNNVLGPNAILLKANEDTYFAFTALNNLTFQKQLFENVGSSGQPKFNKTELKSIQLYMPQNEEQEKIGQYFRDLDHLITLHHRKYTDTLKAS